MVDRMPVQTETQWQSLVAAALAASDDDPTVRFAQLATVARNGAPYTRTVVIREFRPETGELRIVTDVRSRKVGHLRADPRAALCWYLTSSRQQFRFRGRVMLVDETADEPDQELRSSAWTALSASTRQQFYWPVPGTPRTHRSFDSSVPPEDEPPDTFVLLRVLPDFVDHLVLTPLPHRRTFYRRDDTGHWWMQPVNP